MIYDITKPVMLLAMNEHAKVYSVDLSCQYCGLTHVVYECYPAAAIRDVGDIKSDAHASLTLVNAKRGWTSGTCGCGVDTKK